MSLNLTSSSPTTAFCSSLSANYSHKNLLKRLFCPDNYPLGLISPFLAVLTIAQIFLSAMATNLSDQDTFQALRTTIFHILELVLLVEIFFSGYL